MPRSTSSFGEGTLVSVAPRRPQWSCDPKRKLSPRNYPIGALIPNRSRVLPEKYGDYAFEDPMAQDYASFLRENRFGVNHKLLATDLGISVPTLISRAVTGFKSVIECIFEDLMDYVVDTFSLHTRGDVDDHAIRQAYVDLALSFGVDIVRLVIAAATGKVTASWAGCWMTQRPARGKGECDYFDCSVEFVPVGFEFGTVEFIGPSARFLGLRVYSDYLSRSSRSDLIVPGYYQPIRSKEYVAYYHPQVDRSKTVVEHYRLSHIEGFHQGLGNFKQIPTCVCAPYLWALGRFKHNPALYNALVLPPSILEESIVPKDVKRSTSALLSLILRGHITHGSYHTLRSLWEFLSSVSHAVVHNGDKYEMTDHVRGTLVGVYDARDTSQFFETD